MKKIILVFLALFILSGCSKTAKSVGTTPANEVPNPKGYMSEPQIIISTEHQYKDEGWVSEDTELKDSSITLNGKSIFVTVIFQGSVSEDSFKKAVKLEGFKGTPDITITPSEGKTVYYGCFRDLEMSKPYSLIVSRDISDSEGKTLQADVKKEITLKPDTIALYTYIADEGSFSGLGQQSIADAFAVGNMNLTPEPKTIIIDFSAEVDKASVEGSISKSLKDTGSSYKLQWEDNKKLMLKLENLRNGEPEPYNISMAYARDIEGGPILGNFYFVTAKPNSLGSIDIKTKQDTLIYNIPNRRYMAVQSPHISNSIVLDDTKGKFVFNMAQKTLSRIGSNREYTLGVPGVSFKFTWKDSNTMLMLNWNDGTIISYSVLDGSSKELFSLPIDMVKNHILEISASPDGRKLAVAYLVPPTEQMGKADYNIEVFDFKGNSLYEGKNVFRARYREVLGDCVNLSWMNNDVLILEDNISKADKLDFNVISLNTKTGAKEVVAEHSFKPASLQDQSLVKVESFKEFGEGRSIDIWKNGKKIRSFKAESYEYENFFFVDQNTLVFNDADKIFAYYLDTGKSEKLGTGYIIGLSEDNSKLYYITNHKMLYYFD